MKALFLTTAATMLGIAAVVPGAIADETVPSPLMSDLDLPPLANPLPVSFVGQAPKQADVLPTDRFVDVSPNHWAYSAVNNLATDYACVSGYPDGSFRGSELVTRYEFAAALDACLTNLLQIVEQERTTSVDSIFEDLSELQRELGTLSDDVEGIELETAPK